MKDRQRDRVKDREWRRGKLKSCCNCRVLLLAESNPADWAIIDSFMDHDSDRKKKDSPAWRIHELLVSNFVRDSLGLDQFTQKVSVSFMWQLLITRISTICKFSILDQLFKMAKTCIFIDRFEILRPVYVIIRV